MHPSRLFSKGINACIFSFLVLKLLRSAVKTIFRWTYPNYNLVSSNSLRCTLDTCRHPGIVTVLLTLQGKVSVTEARLKILTEIVEKKVTTQNGGQLNHLQSPNLKKILSTKLGCYVWQNDDHFHIDHHVAVADVQWKGHPITEKNLQSFVSEQCCRPFPKKMSPWQVLLIPMQSPDVKTDSVVILIRLHHLLSEGLSLKQIMKKTLIATSNQCSPTPPPSPLVLTPTTPRSPFQLIPKTYSVFASSSATKQTLHQLVDTTHTTIKTIKSKCNLQAPQDDKSTIWFYIRRLLQAFHSFFVEFQKLYEMTEPHCAGRSAWYRAGSLIYFAPRLLGRFDWTRNISVSLLLKQFLNGIMLSPVWILQLSRVLCCTLYQCCSTALAEIQSFCQNGRPIYALFKLTCREIWETVQTIVAAPSLILKEFLQQSNHYPLLRRSGSGRKIVVWSEPIAAEVLQRVKESSFTTTSEVLASVCAGALTQYFKMMGFEVPDNILTTIPIYSKDFALAEESGADGFITLSLPTGDVDSLGRLTTTRQRMENVRASPSKYLVSVALLNYLRHILPDAIVAIVIKFLSRQYLILLTNIIIPSGTHFKTWGRDVKSIGYWKPPQANTALSLNLVTYKDQVSLMATSDQDIVPQPQIITEHFVKEFNSLACALGVRRERRTSPTSSQSSHQTVI